MGPYFGSLLGFGTMEGYTLFSEMPKEIASLSLLHGPPEIGGYTIYDPHVRACYLSTG